MTICASCGAENPPGFRFCGHCAATLEQPEPVGHEQRKTVTILFCDVSGSTELGERLDPESLRQVMLRYFDAMKHAIERHGGTVEKFIGDAVMAVFGVPITHEDDALRAVRAVRDMQRALAELNEELARAYGASLEARVGINTGEVVTGTAERLATGDAVNVAARLEQAASPGEVLLGLQTLALVRGAVEADAIEPLTLKGKASPVPAYRLVNVSDEAPARPTTGTLVGRERELEHLHAVLRQTAEEGTSRVCTVIGTAGIGKSRLVAELLGSIGDAAVVVVRGRCLPYGEGITYWPVVEVVRQLPTADELDLEKPAARALQALLDPRSEQATSEEINWAFRRLLEAASPRRPLVCVFDDLQWGEEAFLDLVEQFAFLPVGGSVLLLCMARPDLLDRRPGWDVTLKLDPLDDAASGRLVAQRLAETLVEPTLQQRILAAAAGNPLFLEEMTAVLLDSSGGDVVVPPTIQALLAARLDQLDHAERSLLECASVEGEVFHRGALHALDSTESQLTARLTALVRKDLIRPERAQIAGDEAFRFRHLLIRDAAYAGIAKSVRANLHARFGDWLSERGSALVEIDELLGYHLEQAYRYRADLALEDATTRTLRERAGRHLAAAARRASARWDLRAAISLQERAVALLDPDDPERVLLLFELGSDLIRARSAERADAVLTEAIATAGRSEDEALRARSLLAVLERQLERYREPVTAEIEEGARRAIRTLEDRGEDRLLAKAWSLISALHFNRYELAPALDGRERALVHARRAGDMKAETELRIRHPLDLLEGQSHLAEVEAVERANLDWARENGSTRLEAASLVLAGRLTAMTAAKFEDGRSLIAQGRALFEQIGMTVALLAVANWSSQLEELAGDLAAAERKRRGGLEIAVGVGAAHQIEYFRAELARLIDLQGRHDEAERLMPTVDDGDELSDLRSFRRCLDARALARRGDAAAATRLALDVLDHAPPPEWIFEHSFWLMEVASILEAAGESRHAGSLAEEALRLYERKGALVDARRTREFLASLERHGAQRLTPS